MGSKNIHPGAAVFATVVAVLLPAAGASQEVVDLPAQDRPLTVAKE
jgi:hypothetical protein